MSNYLNDGKPFRMPDSWYDPPEEPPLVECPECGGTGQMPGPPGESPEDDATCGECNGTGEVDADPYEEDPDDARDRWLDQQREEMEGL